MQISCGVFCNLADPCVETGKLDTCASDVSATMSPSLDRHEECLTIEKESSIADLRTKKCTIEWEISETIKTHLLLAYSEAYSDISFSFHYFSNCATLYISFAFDEGERILIASVPRDAPRVSIVMPYAILLRHK